jgi:MFS family permease
MISSLVGNELADRFGRPRMIQIFMVLAGVCALNLGFLAALPYWIVVTLALVYGGLIQLDSAALTTGVINAAEDGRRGSTLGLYALIGFSGGAVGPLVFGVILDSTREVAGVTSWGYAFASLGIVSFLGIIAVRKLREHTLA